MRIEKDQLIAGLLAKDVRRVMRRVEGCLIRPSTVASILGLSKSRARRILNGLEQEGLVAAKDDFWEITAKGPISYDGNGCNTTSKSDGTITDHEAH